MSTEDRQRPASSALPTNAGSRKFNVLFIVVDDLRCQLGCYGDEYVIAPNIDGRLAGRGVVFTQAYCQQAVCNASRSSLLTGRRPDTTKVGGLEKHFGKVAPDGPFAFPQWRDMHFRWALPNVVTLPQYFMQHGYHARGIGKVYHGHPWAQDPASWSVPMVYNVVPRRDVSYVLPENRLDNTPDWPGIKTAATECADVPDNAYVDGKVADEAIRVLRKIKDQPFFLAVGFRKPHLPFSAPKKYWDLYDRGKLSPPANPNRPKGVTDWAFHDNRELRGYMDIPDTGPIPFEKVMELRHGYYACVSYLDAQIGKLLDELDRLALTDSTIIILWGDHGYHLGEKGLWCKFTNYELDTHAPLILAVPGQKNAGAKIDALVEFVDIYPTLVDLCGLPMPDGLEGISMTPLLDDPKRPWKKAAFSQYPRAWFEDGKPAGVMGRTMRTLRYRYTEWQDYITGEIRARELYDHTRDPAEMHNLVNRLEYIETIQRLSRMLHGGWQVALPPDIM